MPKPESYSVISNPFPDPIELLVLFSGSAQTVPGHKVGPKVVDYYLIHHVAEGRGTFTWLGQQYELGAGDSFLIQPDTLITYTADEQVPWSYQWVAFSGPLASGLVAPPACRPGSLSFIRKDGAFPHFFFKGSKIH